MHCQLADGAVEKDIHNLPYALVLVHAVIKPRLLAVGFNDVGLHHDIPAVRPLALDLQLLSGIAVELVGVSGGDIMRKSRDQLLLLFANQKYAVLSTREGQETLRQQALENVRSVLGKVGGHADQLEAVYFTSFVMQ